MVEMEQVSLKEICEEVRTVREPDTGRAVKKPAYFSSMSAMIRGAFHFVEFFERLHNEGRLYGSGSTVPFRFDLRNGDFFFDETITLKKEEEQENFRSWFDVSGISEFIAPELVESLDGEGLEEERCSVETDRYFMSVYLFEYFFHTGSPFEGKKMVNRCFLSPLEKELFRARQGKFCMEDGENENSPVKGIQDKLIRFWNEYPLILRKMFQKAFIDGGTILSLRPTEVDWKQVLVHMMMDYKSCSCGFHGYSSRLTKKENGTLACPKCGKVYYPLSNGLDWILLAQGEELYECQTGRHPFDMDTVTGVVVENKQKKGLYGIKNISKGVWRGFYPDGKTKEIPSGQGIPIWNGMMLRFETGEEWTLRLIQNIKEKEEDNNEQ